MAQSYKPLNQVHDSNCLTLENKNQVFRVQLTSPLSCFLWISSDMHYKLMSMADFLCTYEGYHVKNQPIEYPVIEKNRYHLFYKGIINVNIPTNVNNNNLNRVQIKTSILSAESKMQLMQLCYVRLESN